MYKVVIHPRAYKFIKRLPERQAILLQRKLEKLGFNPFQSRLDVKRMKLTKRSWRLRLGKIRVIYEVLEKEKAIWVAKIKFRGDIY